MNSQKNVLQVLSCVGFTGPATVGGIADISELPVGEMAFFDKDNAIATTGWGRFVLRESATEIIQSNFITFLGWDLVSYAAPALHAETVTITGPTIGGYYQLQVTMDIKGMTGKYIKHGVYVAKTGNTVTNVADALVASLNAALAREGNTALLVENTAGVITVSGILQTYIPGKKSGNQVPFSAALISPEGDVLGTVTVPGTNGTGTGNYVHEKEYFAWGNQDSFRYNSWRNNFEPKVLTNVALTYDTQAINEDTYEKTAHGDVRVSKQILLAFNDSGSAPTTS